MGSGKLSDLCRDSQRLISLLCPCTPSLLSRWPYVRLLWASVCHLIFAPGLAGLCCDLWTVFLAEANRRHPCLLTEQTPYSFVGNMGREDRAVFVVLSVGTMCRVPSPTSYLVCYRVQQSRTFICKETFMYLVSIFGSYKD